MTPIWAVTPEKIKDAVERIVAFRKPLKVIVFGSAASGKLHRDSDLDILIITREDLENARKESVRIRGALKDILMAMDILVISQKRLEELKDQPGLIYREALQHGKVVYEEAA